MMGALFYIPLFVQGVIGKSATNSGFVTMPMMIIDGRRQRHRRPGHVPPRAVTRSSVSSASSS